MYQDLIHLIKLQLEMGKAGERDLPCMGGNTEGDLRRERTDN